MESIKGEIISDASGNMAEYWRNFDAAAPLSSLSETERLSAQVGFLHEFALQNSLHDAMQLVAVVNEKEYRGNFFISYQTIARLINIFLFLGFAFKARL